MHILFIFIKSSKINHR